MSPASLQTSVLKVIYNRHDRLGVRSEIMSCDDDLFGKSFKHFRAPWTFAVCSRPWNAPVGWTGGEPALYRDLDTAACLGLVNGAKVDTGKAR